MSEPPPLRGATQRVFRMTVEDPDLFPGAVPGMVRNPDVDELPMFWVAAILNAVENPPAGWQVGQPLVVAGQLSGLAPQEKRFTFSADELEAMRRRSRRQTPEARAEAERDARERGDITGDVNPEAGTNNCGYCVLAWFLGQQAPELQAASAFMEQFDEPDWLDLGQIRSALGKGKAVGPVRAFAGKGFLQHFLHGADHSPGDVEWYVLHFPAHFVVLTLDLSGETPVIEITDPQTHESYDFSWLPEGQFNLFQVIDGPS